jgi:hypothetical protein
MSQKSKTVALSLTKIPRNEPKNGRMVSRAPFAKIA